MKITYEIITNYSIPDVLRIEIKPFWGKIIRKDIPLDSRDKCIGYFNLIWENAHKELYSMLKDIYFEKIFSAKTGEQLTPKDKEVRLDSVGIKMFNLV